MAVVAVWQCDRDGSMFDDKKAADAHDKMLELAECITRLVESEVEGVSETHAEAIGLLLAKRKEDLAKACKGKPELLLPGNTESEKADSDANSNDNAQDGTGVSSLTAVNG